MTDCPYCAPDESCAIHTETARGAEMKRQCEGTGQPPTYKPGAIHPHCPVCDADLSVQGKRSKQKVQNGVVRKHFV